MDFRRSACAVVSIWRIAGLLSRLGRVSATSEAIREIGGAEPGNNNLNSSAGASADIFPHDSLWADRSVEVEDAPRSRSSKFLRYFEFTWLFVMLGIICLGGISAVIGYYNYNKPDQSLDMTRKISELASSVTALEERVATFSDDQARQEAAQSRAVEASETAFQRTFGQLSDRLDDVRTEARERDAGMALRLESLEAKERTLAAAPATPQPTASTSPSDPVAAVNSTSAPVDSAKKDTKHKKHKKLPRTPDPSRATEGGLDSPKGAAGGEQPSP